MQNNVAPGAANYGPSSTANLNPATPSWDVWVKDAKGCETKLDVTTAKDLTPTVTATVQNQCTGTGSSFVIKAVGAGGVGAYTYTINTGVVPTGALLDTFTVAPGTYTITVKDANSCPNTTTVTVNDVLTASAIVTKDITCAIPQEATIKVSVFGGKAPFGYRVKIGAGAYSGSPIPFAGISFIYTATALTGTTYQFEITDGNGTPCTTLTNVVTTNTPTPVTASATKVDPTCNGIKDGSIKITALTGESPFTYSITGVAGTFVSSNVFGGLAAVSYDYAVKDSKGCIFNDITKPIVLNNPVAITPNIKVHDIQCNTNVAGSIEIFSIAGGVAPFVYTLYNSSNTAIHTSGSTSATPYIFPNNLSFGDYYVAIVDSKGCEFKSNKLRISTVPYLKFAPPAISGDCITGATVDLSLDLTFPSAPNYIYSIYGDASSVSPSTSAATYQFKGLKFGQTYLFQVQDNNGCFSIIEVPIAPLSLIKFTGITSSNVSCNTSPATKNGAINFTVSAYDSSVTQLRLEVLDKLTNMPLATPVFKIVSVALLSSITDSFTGLASGSYTLRAIEIDGTKCSNSTTFEIAQPNQPLLSAISSVLNANCNTGAQLTITTTGGTGPYTYAAAVAPGAPSSFSTSNVLNLDYALGSNWNITVKDFKGCTVPMTKTIIKDPSPVVALNVTNKCVAEGAFNISVTQTTAGVGPYYISINSPTAYQAMPATYPGTAYTVTGLSSGLKDIYVKDSNGCFDKKSVTIAKPLNLTPTITALPTCADNDGIITVAPSGGAVPNNFEYTLVNTITSVSVGPQAGNSFSGLAAGNYTVTLKDKTTPCSITVPVVLSKPNKPTFNTTVNNTTCFTINDGIITVNLTGANVDPVYTYAISPNPPGSVQVGNVFSKLPAGLYTITVRSGRGCSTSVINVEVKRPLALSAIAAITDYACNATNIPQPAKVTVNVTAGTGTGPYKYNFDGSTNYYDSKEIYVVDNGSPQTVSFYVKDFNGCLYNSSIVVNPYKKITSITFNPLTQPTCPIPTSNVKLTVVGGYAITKYEILSPASAIGNVTGAVNGTFIGLAPDTTYLFKVTDANGCSFQKAFTTSKLTRIAIVGELVNNISCNVLNGTTNNGTARYTVTGFSATGNYTVVTSPVVPAAQITKVGDVITLSGLSAGSYKVTVTDNTTGCSKDATVTITNPIAIAFTATATKVFCSKDVSQITVSGVSGGTGAYTYAVVKAGLPAPVAGLYTSSNILTVDTNLTDLSWVVYVKDANGCIEKKTVPVLRNAPPTINVPVQQCFTGGNLTIDLSGLTTVYGGVKSYTLNGSALASSIATFTAPGTYKLGIKDDNGCEAFINNFIIQKQLLSKATLTKDLYCAGSVNATIKVDITDGVGPYSSQMYLGGVPVGSPYVGANFTASVATAGDYTFVSTDSNAPACSVIATKVTVTTPVAPVIVSTPILEPILCTGGSATMQVNVNNAIGLAPYTYSVTRTLPSALPPRVQVSNNVFTGLTAGTYTVTVTDAKGCPATTTKVITEPVILTATASFPANSTCNVATVITVVGHDGTPLSGGGYYYNFNNKGYTTTNTFTVNDNGAIQTISYTVKDKNGCITGSQTVIVNPLNKPTNLDFAPTAITCKPGESVSTVTVKATNGVGGLSFKIIATNTGTAPALWGPVTTTGSAIAASFPGLLPGDYTFEVTDANGCSYQELYTVKDVVKIAATGQLIAGVGCKTEANGKVLFTVSGFGAGGFTPIFTGVNAPGVITPIGTDKFELTNLVTGNYRIDVTDNTTGCVSNFKVFVPEPALLLGVNYVTVKNANCNLGAQIKASAFGGTTGYTYALVKTGGSKVYSNSDTAILDPAFTWVVWAKDAHGCEASTPITIITDPIPVITSVVATQCSSTTGTYDITVTASAFSPFLEYSLDGNSFQSGNVLTVTSPGNYTVTVRDANQCTATAVNPVTILEPLQLQADLTTIPTCLNSNGVVTLTAKGGTVPASYQYSKDGSTYGLANVFGSLAPKGTPYIFYVKDMGTNCVKTVDIIIDLPNTTIDFSLSQTGVTCKGDSDGTITVDLAAPTSTVNNNPIYRYTLTGTVARPIQDSNIFSDLPAGNYTVTVTSGRGCPVSKDITVDEPAFITFPTAPVVTPYGCASGSNGTNYAVITVSAPTGGSNVFPIYEFIRNGNPTPVQKGGSPTFTEVDLLGGSYTINVYDSKGCLGTTTATISPFVKIDFATPAAITVTKPITCVNDEEIKVNVATTGTTVPMPTLIYNVKGVSAGSNYNVTDPIPTGVFTGLTVGNYIITVTNPTTGCSIKTVHYVNEPNTFDLTIDKVVDVSCFNGTDGSANITFIDRVISATDPDQAGPFDYTVVDASGNQVSAGPSATAGPITISGLAAGIYTVTATLNAINSSMCSVTKNFTISRPAMQLAIAETHTPITCVLGDGSISATATGGWPGGYEFRLELTGTTTVIRPWSTNAIFTSLTKGDYTVRVRDSKLCSSATVDVSLVDPTPIAITVSPDVALSCFGDTSGVITANASFGKGTNYLYTLNIVSATPIISSGPQALNVFSGLGAGRYTVTVSDGWGCSITSSEVKITEPTEVTPSLVLNSRLMCTEQARLTLSVSGGTPPYTYSADGITYDATTFNPSVTFPVPVGTHHYYVKDANDCVSYLSNDIQIDPLVPLTINLEKNNPVINCAGDSDGVIVATAQGGLGNYSYTLTNVTTGVVTGPQPTGNFTGLIAGDYKVHVDSDDCSKDALVTITEPKTPFTASAIPIPVTCNGNGDGKIIITAAGGTGIIKYAISPNSDQFFVGNVSGGHSFNNLKPGFYAIIAQDQNGCFHTETLEITEPDAIMPTIVANSMQQELCVGEKTGAFSITITGGTAPYSTSLDDPKGTYVLDKVDFLGLSGGDHTVYIKDANGCEFPLLVPLDPAVILDPIGLPTYDCVNDLPANIVTVTIDPSNTDPSLVKYSLDGNSNQQSSNLFINVPAGDHFVMVEHSNGCVDSTPIFTVDQIEPLAISIALGELNEIVATTTGGSGIYQYTVNGESIGSNNKYIYYKSGDYTFTVTDSNGCVASATKYFEFVDIKIPNIFTPDGSGTNDTWKPMKTENYPDIKFIVYDRYGRVVGTFGAGQSWDGKYNGTELPMGDYWYVLKLRNSKDDREFVGHFTLYR